jgi:hypothetical protein
MESSEGIPAPIEVKEKVNHSESFFEANAFKSKGRATLEVNGLTGEWHIMKGKLSPYKDQKGNETSTPNYIVLYNPMSHEWLKIVPPQISGSPSYPILQERLAKSVDIGRKALQIAGLPELADQFQETKVMIRGEEVYGFTSPHIGPSLQYILRSIRSPEGNGHTSEDPSFFSQVYEASFDQAARLFLEHGVWTQDPNPGNILLHEKDGKIKVGIIDFSNRIQTRHNRKSQGVALKELANIFSHTTSDLGIPFAPDIGSYHVIA